MSTSVMRRDSWPRASRRAVLRDPLEFVGVGVLPQGSETLRRDGPPPFALEEPARFHCRDRGKPQDLVEAPDAWAARVVGRFVFGELDTGGDRFNDLLRGHRILLPFEVTQNCLHDLSLAAALISHEVILHRLTTVSSDLRWKLSLVAYFR